jgi:RNA polymerase sigma-70 factor (ECF subfamily)
MTVNLVFPLVLGTSFNDVLVLKFRGSNSRERMSSGPNSGLPRPSRGDPELRAEELLVQVAGRDVQALASLYDQFAPSLLGILVRMLTSKWDAESALEEVFLRLWREAHDLVRTQGSVAAWLVLVARQVVLERVRAKRAGAAMPVPRPGRQSRRKAEEPANSCTESSPGKRKPGEQSPAKRDPHPGFFLAARQLWLPRPEDIALAEARLDLLQKAFDQMPKPQRRALELAVFEAYNESEIAAQLGEPLGKVSAGLRAAFTFLRHRQHAVLGTWTADI